MAPYWGTSQVLSMNSTNSSLNRFTSLDSFPWKEQVYIDKATLIIKFILPWSFYENLFYSVSWLFKFGGLLIVEFQEMHLHS
jgi:hypothetical protein